MRTEASDGAEPLLLVEDNPGDVRLVQEALAESRIDTDLHVVSDGEAALEYLNRRGKYAGATPPHLVLLDLNLPKVDGLTVLERMQDDPVLARVPVVVLTGSSAEEDIVRSYELHSNAYLMKPNDLDGFVDLVRAIKTFWLTMVQRPPTRG